MSNKLISATGVLCHLLEQSKPTINGSNLLGGAFGEGGHELVRERLLTIGPTLSYVTCPDCGIELSRVVRTVGVDRILLHCEECGEVEAMLRAVGIESTAALVNMGEAFDFPEGPAANSPINHVITYIPSMDLYLDSTAQLVPFGKLDEQVLDKPTVLVALNRLGRTPKMQAADNTQVSRTELTLLPDGRIEGINSASMTGTLEINARFQRHGEQSEPMESTVNQLLLRFNEIGVGKVLVTPSMKTDKPFEWASHFSLEPIADLRRSGAFTIPVGTTPGYIAEKTLHKPLDKREFPFVCESVTAEEHVTLNLPETIDIESIPADVTHQSAHIRYAARYVIEGRQLQIKRSLVLDYPSRVCAPDLQAEVVDATRVIRADFKGAVVFRTR